MSLTKRQSQIVTLLAQGNTAEQCADSMHRSINTIRKHVSIACDRAEARNVTHLVALSISKGWINVAFSVLFAVMLLGDGSVDKARNLVRIRIQRSSQQFRKEA